MMTKALDQSRRFYLRERRLLAKLTQEELAEAIGTSKSMVSQMETGSHRYNEGWVSKIAVFLDIEPAALFVPPGESYPAIADEILARVIRAWEGIPEGQRIALAQLAESFKKDEAG